MESNTIKLPLAKSFLFLLIFCICVGVLLFSLATLDRTRKEAVYKQYATETDQYIRKNRGQLLTFFRLLSQTQAPCPSPSTSIPPCPYQLVDDIVRTAIPPATLKDWSSTAFLVKKTKAQSISIVRLSGEMHDFSVSNDKESLVNDLLRGKVNHIPWDDYSYEFENKEVIIPVTDEKGHVVGAFIRGVIQ